MDILGILFDASGGGHFKVADPTVGFLEVDCVDQETHEWTNDVTTNPVENGSPIADHVIIQPDRITIAAFISNAPVLGFLDGISSFITDGFNGEDRTQAAFTKLYQLRESKALISIYTRYKLYTNMVITNISVPRRPDDGDAINFTIEAIHVNIVSTATTTLPPGVGVQKTGANAGKSNATDSSTQKRATPGKDIGSGQMVGPPDQEKTMGKAIKDAFGNGPAGKYLGSFFQ